MQLLRLTAGVQSEASPCYALGADMTAPHSTCKARFVQLLQRCVTSYHAPVWANPCICRPPSWASKPFNSLESDSEQKWHCPARRLHNVALHGARPAREPRHEGLSVLRVQQHPPPPNLPSWHWPITGLYHLASLYGTHSSTIFSKEIRRWWGWVARGQQGSRGGGAAVGDCAGAGKTYV